jgi:hypothetical protein
MDATDMKLLNSIYVKVLNNGQNVYKECCQKNNLQNAQTLESYATYLTQMNENVRFITDLTDKYVLECIEKATEIRTTIDMNNKYKDDPFNMFMAHKKMYGGVSWADLSDKEDRKDAILNSVDELVSTKIKHDDFENNHILYKNISNIYNNKIDFECKIPIINKLNEMPSCMYWYKGDKTNPEGIYICISRKFYVQVPFPDVIDGTVDFYRMNTIKCTRGSKKNCLKHKKELAIRRNVPLVACGYTHTGDAYKKVGTLYRCPNIPRFGAHNSLNNDLENLPERDLKMMLMNSLSDILLGTLWFQKQKNKNLTIVNIDIC